MKTVYFIFENMKEAEYYWRGIGYYLAEDADYDNVKIFRGPFRITLTRYKVLKYNFIERIIMKLTNKKPVCFPEKITIIFKSKKSNLKGIQKDIYYFLKNIDYDACYFLDFIKSEVL